MISFVPVGLIVNNNFSRWKILSEQTINRFWQIVVSVQGGYDRRILQNFFLLDRLNDLPTLVIWNKHIRWLFNFHCLFVRAQNSSPSHTIKDLVKKYCER